MSQSGVFDFGATMKDPKMLMTVVAPVVVKVYRFLNSVQIRYKIIISLVDEHFGLFECNDSLVEENLRVHLYCHEMDFFIQLLSILIGVSYYNLE